MSGLRLPVWPSDEFADGASELDDLARRDLLKLLGATAALAGASCAKPAATLQPFSGGGALHFATASSVAGVGTALIATSRDGRPVKLEGNPEHPCVRGALGPLEQASLLGLYDPNRASRVTCAGQVSTKKALFENISRVVAALSTKNGGRAVRFLCEPTTTPPLPELRRRILEKLPNARFVSWAPLSPMNRYEGARLAFGRPLETLYDFSKARVVLSLDHDFLNAAGENLGHARAWADRREPGPDLSRLYVVEPGLTVTGGAADHRLRAKGSEIEWLLRALVAAMAPHHAALAPLAANAPTLDAATQKWVNAVAKDLLSAGKEALVCVGDRQNPVVHALAHAVHMALGAVDATVTLLPSSSSDVNSGPQALKHLTEEMQRGLVDVLVITAFNPVYAASASLDFAKLLQAATDVTAKNDEHAVIYLGAFEDETAAASQWFVPRQHFLESWGDSRAIDGSVLFQQPLVEPLHTDAVSEAQLFSAFIGEGERDVRERLRDSWKRRQGDAGWEKWLQSGFLPASAATPETAVLDVNAISQVPVAKPIDGVELALVRDSKLYDGRAARNVWLQELPDPVTKLTWDNAALLSPATAKRLALTGAMVKLTVAGVSLNAPYLVLPGHADDVVTLPLGWGQAGTSGVNGYRLRQADAPYFTRVEVERADGAYELASTQQHWTMDGRQAPAQSADATAVATLVLEGAGLLDRTPELRWGMAIDLNRCTGCSACVLACQAENNIPVVGKQGVLRQRETSWIRVDRYFIGEADSGALVMQPVTCQHCESAPCEGACPVGATPRSDEGVNTVIYNRCIGAKSCASHCPYKVRRFNYVGPTSGPERNPDVSVRSKGVVEKCTFCVQRIEAARIAHRREGRPLGDGAVVTACQQACPTHAIAFGSLADPRSDVSKLHRDARRYALMPELGTRPRNVFLVKVRNPNPELA